MSPSSLQIPQLLEAGSSSVSQEGLTPCLDLLFLVLHQLRGYFMRPSLVKGKTPEHFHFVCSSAHRDTSVPPDLSSH